MSRNKWWGLARAAAFALVVASGGVGCASGQVLTQGEIGRKGSRSFAAPPTTVFYAAVGVLMADGYEIASEDPEQGIIVTKPMAVAEGGQVTARAYRITIVPDDHGGSRMIAAPLLYAGTRDISDRELWTLDGPRGEHAHWTELFEDIDGVLVRPAPDAQEREALAKVARSPLDPSGAKTPAPEAGFRPATLGPGAPTTEAAPDSPK